MEGVKTHCFPLDNLGGPAHANLNVFLQWPRLDENSNDFGLSKMLCFAVKTKGFPAGMSPGKPGWNQADVNLKVFCIGNS